ncbi:MAG: site-specific integrase [Lysobacter sp.]|nr:MAG: site-specific integrase [Lysobacter sp.]
MPKKAKELTVLAVSKLRAEGRHAVGGVDGLHLRIVGGSRAWVLRVVVGGSSSASLSPRRVDVGLGGYPDVSLAEAREKARDHRRRAKEGIDPVRERKAHRAQQRQQAEQTHTFHECSEAYLAAHSAGWKNPKHRQQWASTLATYAAPVIGKRPIAEVDTAAVLAVLERIWLTKTETASRVRGRIESILDWATVRGYRQGENPARWKGHLDKLLPARSKVQKVEHHPALPYSDVATFMADLASRESVAARALQFSILTAARSGEARGATWDEFDFEARTWTVPAERMKMGKEHRIPLSSGAIAVLRAMPRIAGSRYVFTAPRGGMLSDMALTAVLRRMGRGDITQHGFRSTFRDWAGETTAFPREVIEHALAHRLRDKAEAAYQRGDLLRKRAELMEAWSKHCEL